MKWMSAIATTIVIDTAGIRPSMDLRSGQSYWPLKNGILSTHPKLKDDERCQVLVIGAGITGALVAFELISRGIDTVVVDRRDAASGSTAASSALLLYALDTELVELIQLAGEDAAVRAYRLGVEAVDKIAAISATVGDPGCFERRPSLYLASVPAHRDRLRAEYEARARCGFAVDYISEAELRNSTAFDAFGAIRSMGDAALDPLRFTAAVFRYCEQRGLRVYDRTEVTKLDLASRPCRLRTGDSKFIKADQVVFAAGYEMPELLPCEFGELATSYVFVTEPISSFEGWPERALIWETARPYLYIRPTEDGRAIVGGEDSPGAEDHAKSWLKERAIARLSRRVSRMFPKLELEIAHSWAGTFGVSRDGLPMIGTLPRLPHSFVAAGYGGNGITFASTAADIIADLITGRDNSDAMLFQLNRPWHDALARVG